MAATATLTSKGQITIPRDVRRELGLRTGDRVEFAKERDGKFAVRRGEARKSAVGSLRKFLPEGFKPVSVEQMKRAVLAHAAADFARTRGRVR